MSRSDREQFEADLNAVFEDGTRRMSADLRELLYSLWHEGVKHGRNLERSLTTMISVVQKSRDDLASSVGIQKSLIDVNKPSESKLSPNAFLKMLNDREIRQELFGRPASTTEIPPELLGDLSDTDE